MGWDVVAVAEFEAWYLSLSPSEQDSIDPIVDLLVDEGVNLRFPYSSRIEGSDLKLRELRIQHAGRPYRILYAFDPTRTAVLLLGGDKTGDNRWYETQVPKAAARFVAYLRSG